MSKRILVEYDTQRHGTYLLARITDGGISPTDQRIIDYTNEAHMRLMPKGDYVNTLVRVTGMIVNQYVVLPVQLHSLRSLTLADQQTAVTGFMGGTGTATDNQYNVNPIESGFILSSLKFDRLMVDQGDTYDGNGNLLGRQYFIPGTPVTGNVPFQAIAKLRYQAITSFTQTPIIQNVAALKKMIHSIFLEEKNQMADSANLEGTSVQYLTEEAKNFWGDANLENVNDTTISYDNTLKSCRRAVSPLIGFGKDDLRSDRYINVGQRRLIDKGLWKQQFQKFTTYTLRDYVTLPFEIESAYMVTVDRIPGRIFGQWYEFQESGPGEIDRYRTQTPDIVDLGFGFQLIYDPMPGFYIAITSNAIEASTTLFTVTGTDQNNLPVTKTYEYANGNPVFDTTQIWNSIKVQKTITQGTINLYYQNVAQPLDTQLIGQYQPYETVPNLSQVAVSRRIFPHAESDDSYALQNRPFITDGEIRPVRE